MRKISRSIVGCSIAAGVGRPGGAAIVTSASMTAGAAPTPSATTLAALETPRRLRRLPPAAPLADPHPRQPRPRRAGLGGGAGADPQAPLPRLGHRRLRRHHRSRRERRDGPRPPSAAEPRPPPELEELSPLRAGRHPAAHRQQSVAGLASCPTSSSITTRRARSRCRPASPTSGPSTAPPRRS